MEFEKLHRIHKNLLRANSEFHGRGLDFINRADFAQCMGYAFELYEEVMRLREELEDGKRAERKAEVDPEGPRRGSRSSKRMSKDNEQSNVGDNSGSGGSEETNPGD